MPSFSHRDTIGLIALLALQALVLYSFGQPPICACGYVKLWEGVVLSPGNSQHLTDWYTFSHIIHGVLFYGLLRLLLPSLSVGRRLLIALGIEISWELLENTPWLIEHYRVQALAVGYSGDSIINSIMDSLAMIAGFFLARHTRVWVIIALVVLLEVYVGFMIRDNLTLNVLNFIHQFPAIHAWQAGFSG